MEMATCKLLGTDTNGTGNHGADYVCYCKFAALFTGIITQFKVYSLVAGNAKIAIYADNNGEPGNKIAGNDSGQACSVGWNTLTIGDTQVTKDAIYWLGINTDTSGTSSWYLQSGSSAQRRQKPATYSSFTWPSNAGTGFSSTNDYYQALAGYGILMLSPASISQPVSYGTPTVSISGILISPQGISVIVSCGTPSLRYPQTISPSSIVQSVAIGTPSAGIFGIVNPQGISVIVPIGSPTILKYVWHVILDGRYATETPGVNRTCVVGRDEYGNPVYGTAVDSMELGLVGERLDFQQEVAIPTDSQAASMASAILSKMRLTKAKGVIIIPPNCGQELFDVVQISDSGANQPAVTFRVVGMRFEYNPKQARYEHKLILGAL
jgi:hypothetical protein